MGNRRTFIKKISALSVGTQLARSCAGMSIPITAGWGEIANQFFVSDQLNFNTGSAGMMPIPVYENYIDNTKKLCSAAPYEVHGGHSAQITASMQRLSTLIDAPLQGLSLVRNSTEGLNALLWGLPLKKDDEIIISSMGYPYVKNSLSLLHESKGIKFRTINLQLEDSDKEIVAKYKEAITPATKLIVVTQVTHKDGQTMPVKDICTMSHTVGVEVMVDAAHSIGQIDHSVTEMNCDYYVTSLHKWLAAPLGTGLLYVKEQHIEKLIPSYSYPTSKQEEIVKFDYTGTIAFQNKMTLASVLDFHDSIGIGRKSQRLKELSAYLAKGLANIKDVYLMTDLSRATGIVTFVPPIGDFRKMVHSLSAEYGMQVKRVGYNKFGAIRISLNVHILEKDIDKLLDSVESYLKHLK